MRSVGEWAVQSTKDMKPDPDYIKKVLDAFREHPDPSMDIGQLAEVGLSYQTAEFYFHLRLLNDQGFVERDDSQPGVGVDRASLDGGYCWSVIPLRLTADGHAFAEAMGNSLSLIHISEPTRQAEISYAVFCLKKK